MRGKGLLASLVNIVRWLAMGLVLAAAPALAQTDAGRPKYTAADWAMLPAWCIDTQDGSFGAPSFGSNPIGRNRSPRSDKWTGLFGSDFWHMHHICRAMYHEQRSRIGVLSAKERAESVSRALGDYEYILQNCSSRMILMPEVYYRIGELRLKFNDPVRAGEAFLTARRLKPDYWPAYVRWADQLISLRLTDQALALIQEGLSHSPHQPELLQRLKDLGGQPVPRPGDAPALAADQAAVPASAASGSAS
jgi:hypothetical protein